MERVAVGVVARPHGVRGELRVALHDARSTSLHEAREVWIGGAAHVVERARPVPGGAVLLTVAGIADRDAAETLRGAAVEVARAEVALAPGEVLVADLIGCEVIDERDARLGRVVEVQPGPQDLLVVHDERHERLLPLVPGIVLEVDLEARRLRVAALEDLPVEPLP